MNAMATDLISAILIFCGDNQRFVTLQETHHLPFHIHAFVDGVTKAALDERLGLGLIGIVKRFTVLTTDFDGVAKAIGGDHRGFGVVARDERIGGGRGAVHQVGDLSWRQASFTNFVQHAHPAVILGGQDF